MDVNVEQEIDIIAEEALACPALSSEFISEDRAQSDVASFFPPGISHCFSASALAIIRKRETPAKTRRRREREVTIALGPPPSTRSSNDEEQNKNS